MRINLASVMFLSFAIYILNSYYHPLVNMSFSDEDIDRNVIYKEWKTNNRALLDSITEKHTKYIIKENKEVKPKIKEDINFVKNTTIKKVDEFEIEDIKSFTKLMIVLHEDNNERAFKYIKKYNESWKRLNKRMKTTNTISNISVMIGLLLLIFLFIKRK